MIDYRYINMDYIFTSILRYHDTRLLKIISYNIVCQWWKNLLQQLKKLPPLVRLVAAMHLMRFVIPKMHIHGHTLPCQLLFFPQSRPGKRADRRRGYRTPVGKYRRCSNQHERNGARIARGCFELPLGALELAEISWLRYVSPPQWSGEADAKTSSAVAEKNRQGTSGIRRPAGGVHNILGAAIGARSCVAQDGARL